MRNLFFLLIGTILFFSCKDEESKDSPDSCTVEPYLLSDGQGAELSVTNTNWYLERNEMDGGSVNLNISGSITGDSAQIITFGDGLLSARNLQLNSTKGFDEDIQISFTATSVPQGEITPSTTIYVFNGGDTLICNVLACPLSYE